MAETVAPTLAPEKKSSDVLTALPTQTRPSPINYEKEALFDQLVQERIDENSASQSTPLKTFFTGLLWTGYAVAIVVALVLVWSAASGLLNALPQ